MPATSKVLSIIDKGVQDRVTKNGETLRRHADSAQRWRNLRERIARTDAEMDGVRKILLGAHSAPSENGSNTSGTNSTSHIRNGYLSTPQNDSRSSQQSRPGSVSSTMSRSISPFRKFARKIRGNPRPSAPATPVPPSKNSSRTPSSDPVPPLRAHKSFFSFRGSQPPTPVTPDRPGHKYSQSLTPESSPASKQVDANAMSKNRATMKQRWNSSTKVKQEDRATTIKATPLRRHPASSTDHFPETPGDHVRSASRSSMGSSRPWTPVTSTTSTVASSSYSGSAPRPPSRARPPSRSQTPSLGLGTSPRARPKTPSQIPAPAKMRYFSGQSEADWDDDEMPPTSLMQRAFSPAFSTSAGSGDSPSSQSFIPPRPPSRSMIPVPSLQFSSASRPSSAMSHYRSESPPSSFKGLAMRAQTPESAMRARVQQVPFYQPPGSNPRATPRPSLLNKLPPSSYKDSGRSPNSRPASRSGAYTPGFDQNPVHEYIPTNPKDPLDAEVASVVNSIAHGLLVERVDPPLRTIPKEGEEIRAQYAFSTSLSRKVVTCRLTTLTRSGRSNGHDTATKKVMCRVGGGRSCRTGISTFDYSLCSQAGRICNCICLTDKPVYNQEIFILSFMLSAKQIDRLHTHICIHNMSISFIIALPTL
jgi:hypothetical protein